LAWQGFGGHILDGEALDCGDNFGICGCDFCCLAALVGNKDVCGVLEKRTVAGKGKELGVSTVGLMNSQFSDWIGLLGEVSLGLSVLEITHDGFLHLDAGVNFFNEKYLSVSALLPWSYSLLQGHWCWAAVQEL
jgi:hypothetical protein